MPPGVGLVNTIVLPTQSAQAVPTVPHEIGPGAGLITMVTLPIIEWQPQAFVARTVYTHAAVCSPKLMAEPVPATGEPTGLAPHMSWYITPICELLSPTGTPGPPAQ